MSDLLNLLGRFLIATLFLGGCLQKLGDPGPVQVMIGTLGLPVWLVWPVALFNLLAALGLVLGPHVRVWALALATYCLTTSWFHWQLRADPWQLSIVFKNWAIAGGLLILLAQGPGRFELKGYTRGVAGGMVRDPRVGLALLENRRLRAWKATFVRRKRT